MDRANDQSGQSGQPQEEGSWQYKPVGNAPPPVDPLAAPQSADVPAPNEAPPPAADTVEWTASEFVAHDKGPGWYALLILAALGIAGVIYIITKDVLSTVVVLILAIVMGVSGARKPRILTYRLDNNGLTAGAKFHSYSEYKSFALLEEEPFASVVLIPMKRFGLPLSVYLAPEDENRIVETLSRHLPLERGQLDSMDRLMRRVRF